MTIDDTATCLANFIKDANMRGLTGWADAVGNTAPWGTDGSINSSWADEAIEQLYRNGGLNARIAYHEMSNAYGAGALTHSLASLENAVGFVGDDYVRYLGPGEDFMATQGADYVTYAKFAAQKRLSVETHVGGNIGDIISGMEAANAVQSIAPLKWRIAHPDQTLAGPNGQDWLNRAKALNVGWALTFSAARTGGGTPPYRDVMNNSAHMCLGTDAMNVAAWAPFQMLWMVTTGHALLPGVTSVPAAQRLTRAEALQHYTADCAWFIDQDGRLGQLKPGYHADLSVLSDDYFSVADDAIKDLTVGHDHRRRPGRLHERHAGERVDHHEQPGARRRRRRGRPGAVAGHGQPGLVPAVHARARRWTTWRRRRRPSSRRPATRS